MFHELAGLIPKCDTDDVKSGRLLTARLILLVGTIIAFVGLAGYWLWPRPDHTELSTVEANLLGVAPEDFHVSALIAGRDITYAYSSAAPVYAQDGTIICWRPNGTRSVMGTNTDNMIYAGLRNDELTLIWIPRDLFVTEDGTRKLNERIAAGPEVLKDEIAGILGVPIDHYLILNMDILHNLVNALDGIEVNVPQRMYYQDCTGGLDIDLQPGLQVLDGQQASGFIRYRQLPRGDLDRIENVKAVALAMIRRVQDLHVGAVTRLPAIINTFMADVETDVIPADIAALLPRVSSVRIGSVATLPTQSEIRFGADGLVTDPAEVEWFLASVFGGEARAFTEAPEDTLVVTDRSGVDGAADWYVHWLSAVGIDGDNIVLRTGEPDLNPTRLLATISGWDSAGYYAQLLNTGVQQVNRIGSIEGEVRQFELILGPDALARTVLQESTLPAPDPAVQDSAGIAPGIPN